MSASLTILLGNPDNQETNKYCSNNSPWEKLPCQIRKTTKKREHPLDVAKKKKKGVETYSSSNAAAQNPKERVQD